MTSLRDVKVVGMHAGDVLSRRFRADRRHVPLLHYRMRNWGDAINPLFARYFTDLPVSSIDIDAMNRFPASYTGEKFLGVGSIVHHADAQTVIWGSGLQEPLPLAARPARITAVRGPMTRDALASQGIKAPRTYGDPILLLPRFYDQRVEPTHALGVVSHISDLKSPLLASLQRDDDVKLISMRARGLALVDEIRSCRVIASTSLHGLVLADAYGIPAVWIEVSDKVPGSGFKFRDYHATLSGGVSAPIRVDGSATARDLVAKAVLREVAVSLDELAASCPFPRS